MTIAPSLWGFGSDLSRRSKRLAADCYLQRWREVVDQQWGSRCCQRSLPHRAELSTRIYGSDAFGNVKDERSTQRATPATVRYSRN